MISPTRHQLLEALLELSEHYPDMRFGQLIDNLSLWATEQDGNLWDVEDDQLLNGIRAHLNRRELSTPQTST